MNEYLRLLIELHGSGERQGPGGGEETRRALGLAGELPPNAKILDVGSGTGAQTLELAKSTDAHITAVDLSADFLEEVSRRLDVHGLGDRVTLVEASMEVLPFDDGSFDLVWSEGAIYHVGFERGLREWRRLLKPGGVLAVSEISWLSDQRPREIESFWMDSYPEIAPIDQKLGQIRANGYEILGHFVPPESCWVQNYYLPLQKRMEAFRRRHIGNATAEAIVEESRAEMQLYEKYKSHYGYVFYVARLI